jgi:tetratricopeptide (TPR) repeat protein/predicted DNA-binding protein YlxM (UPF0122 family)
MALICYIRAYDLLKDKESPPKIDRLLKPLDLNKLSPESKILTLSFLFYQYEIVQNNNKKSLGVLEQIKDLTNDNPSVLTKNGYKNVLSPMLSSSFNLAVNDQTPDFIHAENLLKIISGMSFSLQEIFKPKQLKNFVDFSFSLLLKLRNDNKFDFINKIEHLLEPLISIEKLFKEGLHPVAQSYTLYLIGIIITELGSNANVAIQYYQAALNVDDRTGQSYYNFQFDCYLGIADSYYKENDFTNAILYYFKARSWIKFIKNLNYGHLHTYKRIAIILTYKKRLIFAKIFFEKSIEVSKMLANNSLINLFESYGDYCTFLILSNDYKGAAICFNKMVNLIKENNLFQYLGITGHCLGWLVNSLDKNWNGKLLNSSEEWTKPNFNMYGKNKPLEEFQKGKVSIMTLLFNLGSLYKKLEEEESAILIFEEIIKENFDIKIDASTKFIALTEVLLIYIRKEEFQKSIDCLISAAIIYENATEDNFYFTPNLKKETNESRVQTMIGVYSVPLFEKLLIKQKTIIEFSNLIDIYNYLISSAESSNSIVKKHISSMGYMYLGLYYILNSDLEAEFNKRQILWTPQQQKKFIDKGLSLVFKARNIAESISFYYVPIISSVMLHYDLTKQIHDLNDFLKFDFDIILYFTKDWENNKHYINNYYEKLLFTWLGFTPIDNVTFWQTELLNHVKKFIIETRDIVVNEEDKFIFIVVILYNFLKEDNFLNSKSLKLTEFSLGLIDIKFKKYFDLFLEKLFSIVKHQISINAKNPQIIIKTIKDCVASLKTFEQKFSFILDFESRNKIKEIKSFLNAFNGKFNT